MERALRALYSFRPQLNLEALYRTTKPLTAPQPFARAT